MPGKVGLSSKKIEQKLSKTLRSGDVKKKKRSKKMKEKKTKKKKSVF